MIKNKIYIFLCFVFALLSNISLFSQFNNLLFRDSLDYKKLEINVNSQSQQFSPILYKNGFIYVSNKKTDYNKIGYNKVYWVSFDDLAKVDSTQLEKKFNLNNTFNAKLSNDNSVLFNVKRKQLLSVADEVEAKLIEFIPEHSFTIDDSLTKVVFVKQSIVKFGGKKRWQLWEANLVNGKLKHEQRIPIPDNNADYFYPFLTENGSVLYFSSNIKGGKGGYDIYKMLRTEKGWSENLENINEINTQFNEISAAIYGKELFFSSNRRDGLGGYDIYMSSNDSGNKNLGYPINSAMDDLGFLKHGNIIIYLSNKDSILNFQAYEHKPIFTNISGSIKSQLIGKPFEGTRLYIKDKALPNMVDSFVTNNTGAYNYKGRPNREYEISIHKSGLDTIFNENTKFSKVEEDVKMASENFSLTDKNDLQQPKFVSEIKEDVHKKSFTRLIDSLKTITKTYAVIHHQFNKINIVDEDILVYNRLIKQVQKNIESQIVIVSGADCYGTDDYNKNLSLLRARSVCQTLSKFNNRKVIYFNVGNSQLITSCLTGAKSKKQQLENRYSYIFIIN